MNQSKPYRSRPLQYWISRLLDYLLPKDADLVLVEDMGRGDTEDIIDYYRRHKPDIRLLTFCDLARYGLCKRRFLYLRAKTVIVCNSNGALGYMTFSKRKTVIQLWHGSPLKSLAYTTADDDTSYWRDHHRCSAFIVSSKLEAAMISWCFNVHAHKIHLLGRARCDRLFEPTSPGPKITDFTGPLPPYDKLILLCPTFRHAQRFAQRSKLMPIEDFDAGRLRQFLERHRAVLLIRGHYMRDQWECQDHPSDETFAGESDRIVELDFKRCPNIYQVLEQIDVLVTDYSSIYFDFLLLNRPIIFTPFDLQQYQLKRGLLYDDFNFWTPGPKVTGFDQWLGALEKAFCGDDGYESQRMQMNRLFNTYQTGDTCCRIVALIDRINENCGKSRNAYLPPV